MLKDKLRMRVDKTNIRSFNEDDTEDLNEL